MEKYLVQAWLPGPINGQNNIMHIFEAGSPKAAVELARRHALAVGGHYGKQFSFHATLLSEIPVLAEWGVAMLEAEAAFEEEN